MSTGVRSSHILPVVHIFAGLQQEDKVKDRYILSCPVYKYQTNRDYSNFVLEIDLRTDGETTKWIMRGIACALKIY